MQTTMLNGSHVQGKGIVVNHTPNDAKPGLRIHFPDMFSSIMAADPVVNVHYDEVKEESAAAIKELLQVNTVTAEQYAKADFAFLCAIWVPYADKEALRTLTDWQYWAFMFDDQFDEGRLKDDPIRAKEEVEENLSMLESNDIINREEKPLLFLFQEIWLAFKKRSSLERQERFKEYHRIWFDGLLEQVDSIKQDSWFTINIEEYMVRRRITLGGLPSFVMVEYCCDIQLSREHIDHPSIQECMRISIDLMILSNDILSLPKDLEQGGDINLIYFLKRQDLSEQAAVDLIGRKIEKCYESWHLALAKLPPYGEAVDKELLRYIDCCRNMALGNLHWSFKSERYFGKKGPEVREARFFTMPVIA
ncbi:isoprenoid synthase domain-containing protein [Dactylonectria macrodidyma]|uniref:Terpene synthase n=1 Tax=Dactylonectria macrodidyma TaxID=307937 RepID=A0A9P9ERN9_9HYPO|nr:isoprenoid synthase domain-containing protein [Dactylonectria macrodidyma]